MKEEGTKATSRVRTKLKQDRKPNSSRAVPNNLDRVTTQKRELWRVRGRAAAIFPRENFIARPRVHRVRTRHANYYVWYIAVKFSVENVGPRRIDPGFLSLLARLPNR